ncbi:MAG TPA: MBL fold metallo-hydrolase [Chthoniobacteraceae bacterium]|jgi:glyoxylase-like metal-dependent hydrolase (beta-lactamase superfamily II)
MQIPLEDQFNDIIGKAMRGLKLTDAQVATAASVTPAAVHELREGRWNELTARQIAPILGLKTDALIASGTNAWQPQPIALDGLARFHSAFDDMTVNSYLIWDPASRQAAAFDTGSDCTDLLALAAKHELHVGKIFLTHTHGDHIFELDRLKENTGAPAFVGEHEPLEGAEPFPAGSRFEVGGLRIETRLTWGHSKGGITYVIEGLGKTVAIVGDALFAGSIGGGMVSYEAALHTNQTEILTLPEETILGPGHGPMTTVAEEKIHNPFFP